MQYERIVDLHQFFQTEFFQTNETLQRWRLLAGTTNAMYNVMFFGGFADEQHIEYFRLKFGKMIVLGETAYTIDGFIA